MGKFLDTVNQNILGTYIKKLPDTPLRKIIITLLLRYYGSIPNINHNTSTSIMTPISWLYYVSEVVVEFCGSQV